MKVMLVKPLPTNFNDRVNDHYAIGTVFNVTTNSQKIPWMTGEENIEIMAKIAYWIHLADDKKFVIHKDETDCFRVIEP